MSLVNFNARSAATGFRKSLSSKLLKLPLGIVLCPLFLIANDFVGFLDLVEFFLFLFLDCLISKLVGVSLQNELLVGCFYH